MGGQPPSTSASHAFELQRVKPLLIRASKIGPTATLEQECGYSPRGRNPHDAENLRAVQDTFRFSGPAVTGGIEDKDGLVSLYVGDWILQFAPDPDDGFKLDFRCWTYEIIVT
jgi:hypothetical protein